MARLARAPAQRRHTILIQNMLEKDIQVFRLDASTLTDTGQRIKLSGGGAAMRTAKY